MMQEHTQPTRRQRTRLRTLAAVALAVGIVGGAVLILTPYAIEQGTIRWLRGQGMEQAEVENVDFNPFTGTLALIGVKGQRSGDTVLDAAQIRIDLDWLPLLRKEFYVRELDIRDAHLLMVVSDTGAVTIAGIVPGGGRTTAATTDWTFTVDRWQVTDSAVTLRAFGTDTRLAARDWRIIGLSSRVPAEPARLQLEGALNDAGLSVQGTVAAFADEPRWTGQLRLEALDLAAFQAAGGPELRRLAGTASLIGDFTATVPESGRWRLNHQGRIRVTDLDGQSTDDARIGAGAVAWDGALRLASPPEPGGRLQLNANGSIRADRLELTLPGHGLHLSEQQAAWEGNLELTVNQAFGGPRALARGNLRTRPWMLELAQNDVTLAGAALTWRGRVGFATQDVPTDLSFDGDLALEELRVERPEAGLRLTHCKGLRISALSARGTQELRANEVALQQASLLASVPTRDAEPPGLTAALIRLEGVALTALHQLEIEGLTLEDSQMWLRRTGDGQWAMGPERPATASSERPSAGTRSLETVVRVGAINMGGTGELHFTDQSVEPAFRTQLDITEARLTGLDSSQPERPSPFLLRGKIGQYTNVQVNGSVAPLSSPLQLNVSGKIENLDLPPLSPYSVHALGYRVTSGHLDATMELGIAGGRLDGTHELTLRNLTVDPATNDQTEQLAADLHMPLGSALDLLRDKENNIRIAVPISGDLSDPRFSMADAINKALGKTVRLAAVSYLTHTLQPYGTVITLAKLGKKAAEAANVVRLQPVLFGPGDIDLDTRARDYVKHIAKLLRERPQLQLRLCGLAVPADRNALAGGAARHIGDDTLLGLARQRAERVKDALVGDHRITPERLFVCHPDIDDNPQSEPRVRPVI